MGQRFNVLHREESGNLNGTYSENYVGDCKKFQAVNRHWGNNGLKRGIT